MIDWQNLVVWPYLLGGAAICAIWNWRAGLIFAGCVLSVKLIQHEQIEPQQVYFFALYSFLGVISFFAWDKHAGVVLCVVGILYAFHLGGVIPQFPKIVMVEIALFLGMLICAYAGPSGGILAPSDNLFGAGHPDHDPWGKVYHARSKSPGEKGDGA